MGETIETDDDWDDGAEVCDDCSGYGYYHDCGEDTCCCLDPDEDDLFVCDSCGGSGFVR